MVEVPDAGPAPVHLTTIGDPETFISFITAVSTNLHNIMNSSTQEQRDRIASVLQRFSDHEKDVRDHSQSIASLEVVCGDAERSLAILQTFEGAKAAHLRIDSPMDLQRDKGWQRGCNTGGGHRQLRILTKVGTVLDILEKKTHRNTNLQKGPWPSQ